MNTLIKELEKKYTETKDQNIFKYVYCNKKDKEIEKNYYKYAGKIYEYLLQSYEKQPIIIEGSHIYKYIKLGDIKGTLIIKRTSLIHSYKRAFNRDIPKLWGMYKSGKIEIKQVKRKFLNRIKLPIKDYKQINRFIKEAMLLNKTRMEKYNEQ